MRAARGRSEGRPRRPSVLLLFHAARTAKLQEWTTDFTDHTDRCCSFDKIIVELKVVRELAPEHRAQMINYLRASGTKLGLLVNFGASEAKIERFAL